MEMATFTDCQLCLLHGIHSGLHSDSYIHYRYRLLCGYYNRKICRKKKKVFLIVSIIANVGILAVFKYYNFFIENVNELFHLSGQKTSVPYLNIILPIGLSFHTFQAMSYTIEVYRGNQPAENILAFMHCTSCFIRNW
jgi:D-alanyl-lipoteichoic acid acyltransferase DltB (MBOAT superfamily)